MWTCRSALSSSKAACVCFTTPVRFAIACQSRSSSSFLLAFASSSNTSACAAAAADNFNWLSRSAHRSPRVDSLAACSMLPYCKRSRVLLSASSSERTCASAIPACSLLSRSCTTSDSAAAIWVSSSWIASTDCVVLCANSSLSLSACAALVCNFVFSCVSWSSRSIASIKHVDGTLPCWPSSTA